MKSLRKVKCQKCGSSDIIPGMEIKDTVQHDSDICIQFVSEPDAFFNKGILDSRFEVLVCGECGYMEFYALDPHKLKDAFERLISKMS